MFKSFIDFLVPSHKGVRIAYVPSTRSHCHHSHSRVISHPSKPPTNRIVAPFQTSRKNGNRSRHQEHVTTSTHSSSSSSSSSSSAVYPSTNFETTVVADDNLIPPEDLIEASPHRLWELLFQNNTEIALQLLNKHKVSSDELNFQSWYLMSTPLHLCAALGDINLTKKLLESGADFLPSTGGVFPSEWAQNSGHIELSNFLANLQLNLTSPDSEPPVYPLPFPSAKSSSLDQTLAENQENPPPIPARSLLIETISLPPTIQFAGLIGRGGANLNHLREDVDKKLTEIDPAYFCKIELKRESYQVILTASNERCQDIARNIVQQHIQKNTRHSKKTKKRL